MLCPPLTPLNRRPNVPNLPDPRWARLPRSGFVLRPNFVFQSIRIERDFEKSSCANFHSRRLVTASIADIGERVANLDSLGEAGVITWTRQPTKAVGG